MIVKCAGWACFLISAISVFGQQGGGSTNRVPLAVVVTDKSGAPVSGLSEQDFKVFDNKRPEQIVSFRAVGQAQASDDTRVILVLDEVNTGFGRVAYEREQVKKFLRQDAGKLSVPVSIDFFTDAGLTIQQGKGSRDGNALLTYLDQHATALRTSNRSQGFYGAEDRVSWSLRALAQLSASEAKEPGRKLVVWISPGWATLSGPNVQLTNRDEQSIFDSVVATSSELWLSNITLYTVDPLGTADSGTFRTFYYKSFLKPVTKPSQTQLGDLSLQVLATHSGGLVLNSANDVAGEIERCVRDAKAYYELTYDAPPSDGPNEYHSIEVQLERPGLKAQTRAGFYGQQVTPQK